MKKTDQNHKTKPLTELLAPAGSQESFHAAVEAGANAIYLGVDEFNARIRAKNFTMQTLSYLVPYAHQNNVSIYITLNTLCKQSELKQMVNLLYQLEQIGIDAVIVQDIGVASIIKKHFSGLTMHASTQMVIHNSAGVLEAKNIGFTRAILSREVTLSEIQTIKNQSLIELELFIHGALCYSISGLCLASSYLGGASGNRGRCTQVCRRRFATDKKSGFYFSPKDFWAIDYIQEFTKIGIDSLKIEGRMKSAEYVHAVVSAYRKLIDNPDQIPDIKKELIRDFGREKTPFFLNSENQTGIITAGKPSGTGILLGNIKKVGKDFIILDTQENLQKGDRIRLHNMNGQEGHSLKILRIENDSIFFNTMPKAKEGGLAYLTSKKESLSTTWQKKRVDIKPKKFSTTCPFSNRIFNNKSKNSEKNISNNQHLFIKTNNIEWLFQLKTVQCQNIILQVSLADLELFISRKKLHTQFKNKLIIALPPFIPEHMIAKWKKGIGKLSKNGFTQWMCGHIGQKHLIPKNSILYADSSIWSINSQSQDTLIKCGFSYFTYSQEDDVLNLKGIGNKHGMMTLFSYIPLFISRIRQPLPDGTFITDSKDYGFIVKQNENLHYLLGEKALCLTHRIDKFKAMGINNFILDLSFCPVDKKTLKAVLTHYTNKEKLPNTTLFNHKAGLK